MPAIYLTVEVSDAQAQAFFDYAGNFIHDARDPLRDTMHEVIFPMIREMFDTEGERSGERWQELSPDYLEWKEANHPGLPILYLTGDGKRAMLSPMSYRVQKDRLIYRPRTPHYMEYHQEGGYVPGRPPQRQIVEITVEDEMHIEDIFGDWLDHLRVAARQGPVDHSWSPGLPDIFVLGE